MVDITSAQTSPFIDEWDGALLVRGFRLAAEWLLANRDRVNALNVFPVPDGDTGTNMSMTMRAAVDAITSDNQPASEIARELAHGALMGARGNSGVILSQFFRGFAAALQGHDHINGPLLARALDTARAVAYKAVMRPVEGTMLTVIRGASERAVAAAIQDATALVVLNEAIDGANVALESTPSLLDILRQAGVVDAGGQGIVYILEGFKRAAMGATAIGDDEHDTRATGADDAFFDQVSDLHGEDELGYCTNFMVFGTDFNFEQVRSDLSTMGESAVIVGDETTIKVHIHTEEPGKVLAYATGLGSLDQIKIDNMRRQTEVLTRQRAKKRAAPPEVTPFEGSIAIVAVAAGDGLAEALRAMGATLVVEGGQTMNPSTRELLQAVDRVPVQEVLLLPNNSNIILTANQVASLSSRNVRVVPSVSVPQGLAALAVFNDSANIDANLRSMTSALNTVTTVEITRAVRDVELEGIKVAQGQTIGLINDQLTSAGDALQDVLNELFAVVDQPDAELVTVFTGIDLEASDTSVLKREIAVAFPEAELEIRPGGQPHYLFVISVE